MNKTNCEQKNSETEKEICLENTKNKQNVSSERECQNFCVFFS